MMRDQQIIDKKGYSFFPFDNKEIERESSGEKSQFHLDGMKKAPHSEETCLAGNEHIQLPPLSKKER